MPKQSASLSNNGIVIHIGLSRLNGALCHIRRPISPPCLKLSNPMPDQKLKKEKKNILIEAIHITIAQFTLNSHQIQARFITSEWRCCSGRGLPLWSVGDHLLWLQYEAQEIYHSLSLCSLCDINVLHFAVWSTT